MHFADTRAINEDGNIWIRAGQRAGIKTTLQVQGDLFFLNDWPEMERPFFLTDIGICLPMLLLCNLDSLWLSGIGRANGYHK